LDLITIDLQEKEREAASRAKVQHLITNWEAQAQEDSWGSSTVATPAELGSLKRQTNPFHVIFPIVLCRSAINLRRQAHLLVARTLHIPSIAIILALFFAPLKRNYEAVQSRMGFIQQLGSLYFLGMLHILALLSARIL
jgi:hypothetical protein